MTDNSYNESSIRALKGAERIRSRPSSVLGSSGIHGAFHTYNEIIDNCLDELRAIGGGKMYVTLCKDGSFIVEDTGRGVPLGWNEVEQRYNWDLVYNELYAGGKYDDDNPNYEDTTGLNGLGGAATQYTSEFFEVVSKRADGVYSKSFRKGVPVDYNEAVFSENVDGTTGTRVHWKPDVEVFGDVNITPEMLKAPLESKAHLAGITIVFKDENSGECIEYVGKGMTEFLKLKLGNNVIEVFEKHARSTGEENGKKYAAKIDVTLAVTNETKSIFLHHHNTALMKMGYHYTAFDAAITEFFKEIGKKNGVKIVPNDYQGYLSGVTSTFAHVNVTSFQNQTKEGVDNLFIYNLVYNTVLDILKEAVAMEKPSITTLIKNVLTVALARKRAKELERLEREVNKVKSSKKHEAEKFKGCREKDPAKRELYLVEGDSAAGQCKEARDGRFQAILPLMGKPFNALKAPLEKLLENQVVKDLINTIGTGVDVAGTNTFDEDNLQYHKIIITTDADVDGAQIRVLLFTLFYRLMPKLLEKGYIYIVESHLYEFKTNKGSYFAYSDDEKDRLVEELRKQGITIKRIKRSKGLGQNTPEILAETTMNPETRRLTQLTLDTKDQVIRDISDMLFGKDEYKERKEYIFKLLDNDFSSNDSEFMELLETVNNLEIDDNSDEDEEEEVVNLNVN